MSKPAKLQPLGVTPAMVESCPAPGLPAGCKSSFDHQLWYGAEYTKSVMAWTVHMWISEDSKSKGEKPVTMRISGTRFISTVAATKKGAHWRQTLDAIQALQTPDYDSSIPMDAQPAPKTAKQIIDKWRENGGVCIGDKKTPYETTMEKPAMYEQAWKAGLILARLVYDDQAGGDPGRIVKRQGELIDGVQQYRQHTVTSMISGFRGKVSRLRWWESLTDTDRGKLRDAMMDESRRYVTSPKPWNWWVGPRYNSNFAKYHRWASASVTLPAVSYSPKNKECALRTLAELWLSPKSHVVTHNAIGGHFQQQMF